MSLYPRISNGKDLGRWRAGSFVADRVIEHQLEGRTLDNRDVDWLALGPGILRDEKGKPLLVYLPGVLKHVIRETGVYDVLHPLRTRMTNNRGMASGTKRFKRGGEDNEGARSDTLPISSMMLGAADPGGVYRYCRMTEWTGSNMPEWEKLVPFFQVIAGHFAEQVPDRFSAQMSYVQKTDPAWLVPGTPFTTITVNNCVDPETECLTRRLGWTRYNELNHEDEILAYDPETDTTCWEHLKDLFINPEYQGDMIKISTRSFTALTTPDHRWPMRGRSTHPTWTVRTSETLPRSYWSFMRAAHHEPPVTAVHSDAFVRIAAWYFTEGSLLRTGTSVSICQSDSHNPHHVDEIRRTLKELGAISLDEWRNRTCASSSCNEKVIAKSLCQRHYNEQRYQPRKSGLTPDPWMRRGKSRRSQLVVNEYADGDKIVWVLTGTPVTGLLSAVQGPEKVPSMEFLTSLTAEQLRLFVDTCIKGDGLAERRAFAQFSKPRMDAFMTAAVLAGEAPAANEDGTYCTLWDSRLTYCDDEVTRISVPYKGTVWCPSVPSGHWVARRRGKVYLTGNSYSTGVHKDVGDLEEGFSCLAVLRRGEYEGGIIVFPRYRVGVDMQDGDLLLMDAHQWHGNTRMMCACGEQLLNKMCEVCGAERISVVCYYRTRIADCGTPEQEYERAVENTEKRSQPRKKNEPGVPEPEAEPEAEPQSVPEPAPVPAVKVTGRRSVRKPAVTAQSPEVPDIPAPAPAPAPEAVKPIRKRAVRKKKEPVKEVPGDGEAQSGNDEAGRGDAAPAFAGIPSWEDS